MPDFGAWLPDLAPHNHDGLVTARNVIPSPLGYEPVKDYAQITSALPEAWSGSGTFVGSDGIVAPLAATGAGLYLYSGGAWTSKYATATTTRWQMAQFGDLVICVHGGAPVKYNIVSGTGGLLGGSPPSAAYIAIVRDFVFLAGDASSNSTVYWSAINNSEGWTVGTAQSDLQLIPDGGKITGLIGGEYGLVFQRDAIHRFSYIGTPIIFQRDKVSDGIGCLAPGSLAQAGRRVFFLSQRGFYAFEDGTLTPIGKGKVNETFLSYYSRAELETSLSSAVDPARSLVFWCMPGRLWVYNWDFDRWSTIELAAIKGVSTTATSGVTLDDLDALYPGGIDSMPVSLDDPMFSGGDPSVALINADRTIGSFGSTSNLEALLVPARNEPIKGRRTRVRKARVASDVVSGLEVTLSVQQRLGDVQKNVSASQVRNSGDVPIRVTGRFIQPSIKFQSGAVWTYAMGFDLLGAAGAVV